MTAASAFVGPAELMPTMSSWPTRSRRLIFATTAAQPVRVDGDWLAAPDDVVVGAPLGLASGDALADDIDGLMAAVGLGRADPGPVPGVAVGACVQDASVTAAAAANTTLLSHREGRECGFATAPWFHPARH